MKTYKTHITVSLSIKVREALEEKRMKEEIARMKNTTTSSIVEEILIAALNVETSRSNQ